MQINAITRLAYQGKNQAELSLSAEKNGYKSNEWVTFLQAKQLGLMINKGSKGQHIFKGFGNADEIKDGKIKQVSRPLGFACVFNLDQTTKI